MIIKQIVDMLFAFFYGTKRMVKKLCSYSKYIVTLTTKTAHIQSHKLQVIVSFSNVFEVLLVFSFWKFQFDIVICNLCQNPYWMQNKTATILAWVSSNRFGSNILQASTFKYHSLFLLVGRLTSINPITVNIHWFWKIWSLWLKKLDFKMSTQEINAAKWWLFWCWEWRWTNILSSKIARIHVIDVWKSSRQTRQAIRAVFLGRSLNTKFIIVEKCTRQYFW